MKHIIQTPMNSSRKLFVFFGLILKESVLFTADRSRHLMLILFLTTLAISASAQKFIWSDSFTQGVTSTTAQCENWSNFLTTLSGPTFVSVNISGTFDPTGITMDDPAAVAELARLLSSGTKGAVVSGDYTWIVSTCGGGSCIAQGVALAVEKGPVSTEGCICEGNYAVRPYLGRNFDGTENPNWGGINTTTCSAPSQTMKLEFKPQFTISTTGNLCEGSSLILTANVEKCAGPYNYLWNTGATTQSIDVTKAGVYSVAVSSENCSGSAETSVTETITSVDAGADVTFCDIPVQLNASGLSGGISTPPVLHKFCMFDSPGGKGNCSFTNEICVDLGTTVTNTIYSQSVTVANPGELRFLMYYSTMAGISTFTFKVNDQPIGSIIEEVVSATCTPGTAGQYPRTVSIPQSEFSKLWKNSEPNVLTVEIVSDGSVWLAGIVAEVVVPTEFYSWSPSLGLSDASIQNPVANPTVETLYTVKHTAANGCSYSDAVMVKVGCNTEVACKPVSVVADDNCEASTKASEFYGGEITGQETFSVSPVGPYPVGITKVTLTVMDANGKKGTCETTVTVTDTALPEIIKLVDLSLPNDTGACAATIALLQPEVKDNCGIKSILNDRTDQIFPVGETIIKWTVTDIHNNIQYATQKVTINNVAPVINSMEASSDAIAVNTSISLNIQYTDNNVINALIDWDDNSVPQTVVGPENNFAVSHTYQSSGYYSPTLILTDACGEIATYVGESIAVFDNNAKGASISGEGWYNSMPGAYVQYPQAYGKANFEFVARYKNGDVPEGDTEFNFKAGKLQFSSTAYEWLVINDRMAFLKGSGRVNGTKGYEIMISVVDDNTKKASKKSKKSDKIRVKISDPSGLVIYDTQLGAPDDSEATISLGGGSIEIKSGSSSNSIQMQEDGSEFSENLIEAVEEVTAAYPNPFKESITLRYYSSSNEALNLQLLDITGNVVHEESFASRIDGAYTLKLSDKGKPAGLYILKIKQGIRVEFLRLTRK